MFKLDEYLLAISGIVLHIPGFRCVLCMVRTLAEIFVVGMDPAISKYTGELILVTVLVSLFVNNDDKRIF